MKHDIYCLFTNYSETNYMYCNIHHGILQSKQAYKKVKKVTWGESNTLFLCLHS